MPSSPSSAVDPKSSEKAFSDAGSSGVEWIPIREAAELLSVSVDTVRRWDKKGVVKSERREGNNNRLFNRAQLEQFAATRPLSISEAAAALGVSVSTLRRMEKDGRIQAQRNPSGEREFSRAVIAQHAAASSGQPLVHTPTLAVEPSTAIPVPVFIPPKPSASTAKPAFDEPLPTATPTQRLVKSTKAPANRKQSVIALPKRQMPLLLPLPMAATAVALALVALTGYRWFTMPSLYDNESHSGVTTHQPVVSLLEGVSDDEAAAAVAGIQDPDSADSRVAALTTSTLSTLNTLYDSQAGQERAMTIDDQRVSFDVYTPAKEFIVDLRQDNTFFKVQDHGADVFRVDYDKNVTLMPGSILHLLGAFKDSAGRTGDGGEILTAQGGNLSPLWQRQQELTAGGLACDDCLDGTQIADIYVLNGGDTITGALRVENDVTVTGNLAVSGSTTLRGIGYTWPSAQGSSNSFLQNDGTGALTWGAIGAASITADSLDFTEFKDALTLDADLTIASSASNHSINIDGDTLFVDTANNRVGVGTATPSYKLEVSGGNVSQIGRFITSGPSSYLLFTDSTATGYVGVNEGDTFVQALSNRDIKFWDDTSQIVTFKDGGNVGLGDTSPAAHLVVGSDATAGFADGTGDAYVLNDLEVDGEIYLGNEALSATVLGTRTYTADAYVTDSQSFTASIDALDQALSGISAGTAGVWTDGGAVTYLTSQTDDLALGGTSSSAPFFFDESAEVLTLTNTTAGDSLVVNDAASDTTPFVVDADGNVGVGTTSPGAKLGITIADASHIGQIIGGASGQTADYFNINSNGAANGNIFTVEANGNVGVGYNTPPYGLSVQKTGASTGDVSAFFRNNRTTTGGLAQYILAVSRQGSATPALYFGNDNNSNAVIAANAAELRIGRDVSGTFSEHIRMDAAGLIGVGTDDPSAKLHVLNTTEQLRLGYDATHYTSSTVTSSGQLIFSIRGDDTGGVGAFHLSPSSTIGGTLGTRPLFTIGNASASVGNGIKFTVAGSGVTTINGGLGSLPAMPSTSILLVQNNDQVSDNTQITILGGTTGSSGINFADSGDADIGKINYDHTNDRLEFTTNASTGVYIDSSQRVGIGTATPDAKLDIESAEDTEKIRLTDSTNTDSMGLFTGSGSPESAVTAQLGSVYFDHANGDLYIKGSGDNTNTGWEELSSDTTHMAKMTRDAAQSIPASTDTKIAFDAEEFDVGGIADATTDDRFTVSRAGKYLITAEWSITDYTANQIIGTSIYKNGVLVERTDEQSDHINVITGRVTSVLDLAANDYIEMFVYQNSLDSHNTSTAARKPRMSVIELSAITSGADLAEVYYNHTGEALAPGTVLALDPNNSGGVKQATVAYDKNVLGAVSTKPGLILGDTLDVNAGGTPTYVGLSGRVPVRVSTANGPIAPGDFLTSSPRPGIAMKATRAGAPVLGQALAGWSSEGEIGQVMTFIKNTNLPNTAFAFISPDASQALQGQFNLDEGIVEAPHYNLDIVAALRDLELLTGGTYVFAEGDAAAAPAASSHLPTPGVAGEVAGTTTAADGSPAPAVLTDAIFSQPLVFSGGMTIEGDTDIVGGLSVHADAVLYAGLIVDTVDVANALNVHGDTTLFGNLTVQGNITSEGQLTLSEQQVGEVTVAASTVTADVRFTQPFAATPFVQLTPRSQAPAYWISEQTKDGFTVTFSEAAASPVVFNWVAFPAVTSAAIASESIVTADPPQPAAPAGDTAENPAPTPTPDLESAAAPTPVPTPVPQSEPAPLLSSPEPVGASL